METIVTTKTVFFCTDLVSWVGLKVGCAVFATFFYSLRSESERIWILFASYSHVSVYSQTPFIRIIRLIFASKYSLAQICIHIFNLMQNNTCWSEYSLQSEYSLHWRIFASKYLFWSEYSLENIRILANIRLQIFAYLRIFATFASNYIGKPFTSLRPQ